jgi:hypothetical protein
VCNYWNVVVDFLCLTGPAPYPLADGCQDHLVALAIEESVSSGAPVTTAAEAWADSTL